MIITSQDRTATIEITVNDPNDPYSGYTVKVAVQGVNPFSGQNGNIHFSAFDSFFKRLDEFIKSRQGVVTLEMTEDCRLEFFGCNSRGDVGVRAYITKYSFSGDSDRTNRIHLEVQFQIDGEFVNQLHKDFASISAAYLRQNM